MNAEADYLNFLKIFYHEEVYLADDLSTTATEEISENHPPKSEPVIAKIEEAQAEEESWQWNFTGSETAEIAFILNENSDKAIPEKIEERFTAMLKNLKLDVSQVLIANIAGKSGPLAENKIMGIGASRIVLLGSPGLFPQLFKDHFQQAAHEGKQFLAAPAFSDILKEKSQVMAFWSAMQSFLQS